MGKSGKKQTALQILLETILTEELFDVRFRQIQIARNTNQDMTTILQSELRTIKKRIAHVKSNTLSVNEAIKILENHRANLEMKIRSSTLSSAEVTVLNCRLTRVNEELENLKMEGLCTTSTNDGGNNNEEYKRR